MRSEQAERISGFTLLGVPIFDSAVFALDNYARLELLVKLHDFLPSFLLNPVFVFLCLLVGIALLDRSYKHQFERIVSRASGLVGVEAYRHEQARSLLKPFLLVCVVILLVTPLVALVYSLAYKGTPPSAAHIPPQPICKTADCFPPKSKPKALNAPHQAQTCVGSNCVQGPNFAPLTLNQYGPPPVKITTSFDTPQPDPSPTGHPRASVKFFTDRVWEEGMFAVTCDRPCSPYQACSLVGINPGTQLGYFEGSPNLAAFIFGREFPAATWCALGVESGDNSPIRILSVTTLTIQNRTPDVVKRP